MTDITRIDPGPRMSEATVYGGRIHCSGMIPEDTGLDITGQVKQALAEIDALIARGGSDKGNILTATIWLADIADFTAMNAVWDAWIEPGRKPARATVEARLNVPKMKVEIMVVAAVQSAKVSAALKEEKTMSVKRINAGARMSSAVVHGNTVYLAGITADDAKADVKGQTKQILDKIDKFLAEAGTDKSKVLSANIWLTDIGTWSQMNEVWDAWVSPGNTPARATVEAKLANPALKVEIMVQAAI
jgi:enamine deaminase RidA (YjgF/YER057c/UK114 family)